MSLGDVVVLFSSNISLNHLVVQLTPLCNCISFLHGLQMLKGAVLGQAQAFDEKEKRKPTRAQQIAKKTERHDAIRAEIEAQRLVPAEKPINFDD